MSKIAFEQPRNDSSTEYSVNSNEQEQNTQDALRECAWSKPWDRTSKESEPTNKPCLLEFLQVGAGRKEPAPEGQEKRENAKDATSDRAQQLTNLVKQLGDESFSKRQQATTQLEAAGAEALPYLKDVLTKPDQDVEAQRRAKALVDKRINEFPETTTKQWIAQITAPWEKRGRPFDFTDPPETTNLSLIPEAVRKAKASEAAVLHDIVSNSKAWDKQVIDRFADLKDEYKNECPDIAKVKTLALGQSKLTDTGLERIKAFKNLEHLYVFDTAITDAGLAHIGTLANLKGLHLDSTRITDAGLKSIKNPKLEHLSLFGCRVGDDAMLEVGKLTNIKELFINSTGITDKGVEHLKGLTKMERLALENTAITDDALKHLRGMKALSYLQINMTDVTDDGIKHLSGLTNLETLDLPNATTDLALDHLKPLTKLKELSFDDSKATDAGLAQLKNFPRLEKLFIYKTPGITDTGFLNHIKPLPALKKVNLQETQITKKALDAFGKARPHVDVSAMAIIDGVLRDINR